MSLSKRRDSKTASGKLMKMKQCKIFMVNQDNTKQKSMCVSGYQPSLSLGHRPWYFIVVFGFLQLNLAGKCFLFLFS